MKLPIPEQTLSQHIVVLGKTRSGKSSALRSIVEPMLDDKRPLCIIDPKGDWWGLKLSKDGKRPAYPVVLFSANTQRADIPIDPNSGKVLGELAATTSQPMLITLGEFMIGERTRWFIDFASTFFTRIKGKHWLVIDEVHNFAPKGKVFDPDAGKMLHWANRIASEGLGKGINLLAASQRPQKVHNDFLTSCETLIAKQVIHKADRQAVADWIDGCGDPQKGKEVLANIAQLKRPTGYVWSPEIEFGPRLVEFPMFRTFDSFKPQTEDIELKPLDNLDELKSRLATVSADVKANDPTHLKARIRELEAAAKKSGASKPVDTAAIEERAYQRGLKVGREELRQLLKSMRSSAIVALEGVFNQQPALQTLASEPRTPVQAAPVRKLVAAPTPKAAGNGAGLGRCEMKILTVLSQQPDGCELGRLTLLTGYRKSGGFLNSLSSLRTAGLMEGANTGVMRITDAGLAHGPFPELPQGEELLQYWLNHSSFGQCERKILASLAEEPEGLDIESLCERTNYAKSGGFLNALSALRTAGVLVGRNTEVMRISPTII